MLFQELFKSFTIELIYDTRYIIFFSGLHYAKQHTRSPFWSNTRILRKQLEIANKLGEETFIIMFKASIIIFARGSVAA